MCGFYGLQGRCCIVSINPILVKDVECHGLNFDFKTNVHNATFGHRMSIKIMPRYPKHNTRLPTTFIRGHQFTAFFSSSVLKGRHINLEHPQQQRDNFADNDNDISRTQSQATSFAKKM
jgi:hypothetical protein